MERAKREQVDYVIHCGDFTLDPHGKLVQTYNRSEIPTYHVLGNHDTDSYPLQEVLSAWGMPAEYYFFDFSSCLPKPMELSMPQGANAEPSPVPCAMACAELLAPWVRHLHVFNWDAPQGTVEKYPLAQAVEIWKGYLSKIPGDRALLLEFMPDNRLETLATEAEALRAIAE